MDPKIGTVLDNRYELLEVIGQGGMAIVYKAKCHRLNRMVAVKVLKSELAEDVDFRRRFRDESQAVAMLSHPNIVSVYDVSRGETEYIVMELIDGITLKQYIAKRGRLNWREALHFIVQIMRGLSHAHSRGIVHRDIKPQNIMVLRDGSVKVADFGIAYLQNSAESSEQGAIGSVHYISPEQAKGEMPDSRSDIYSAGVVLYEMLTSRLPFEGENAVSVALQHLSSIPLSPREIDAEVPEALELICMKAMASEITKRYQTCDEMIADLEEFRKNPDTSLSFTAESLRSFTSDAPTQNIPVIANVSTQYAKPIEEEEEEEDEPQKKRNKVLNALIAVLAAAVIVLLGFVIVRSFSSIGPSEYDVPSLLGMTIEEAEKSKEIKDIFTIEQVGERPSNEYKKGEIIEQDPQDGKVGKMNRTIKVFVSSGSKSEKMPDVVGYEYREAILKIKELDLNIQFVQQEEFSETVAVGYVIRTIPEKKEALYDEDTVTLVLSKGVDEKPVTVPSFVGIPLSKVQEQLVDMGLICGEVTEVADDSAEGIVVWQSIDASTQVPVGTVISLKVSGGAE